MFPVKSKLSLFFGTLLWAFSFTSCEKKLEQLPYVLVYKYVNIIPTLANVGILQSYIIPDAGVHGIIIFHKDIDEWHAYDMTCMYKPRTEGCTIALDKTGLLPQCPCCKSVFNLFNDALPQTGPAQQALHEYHVSLSDNSLTITN